MPSELSPLRKAWQTLRVTLIGCGLAEPLLRLGLLGLEETP